MEKKMRNAFIRISAINKINTDNKELGLKAGDIINYHKDDIINILEKWTETKAIKYYMIEHNKDESNIHYHIVIDFPLKSQASFKTIKNKFPYGDIERCKYGVKNCVQYLVHMNEEGKEKYEWSEVITNAPDKLEDYKIPGKQNADAKLQKLLDSIIYGELKRYEINKIEPQMYIKHGRKIERAFEYRDKILLSNSSRHVQVYLLQGNTGLGKSTFCRKWAEDNNQSIYFSSASNDPWQDYNGQDIFVYDDFRPYNIHIEDMMKSIDPYINSTSVGRYKNKLFIGDTIFITTNIQILDWFKSEEKSLREAFFRRIDRVLQFDKDNENSDNTIITIKKFNDTLDGLIDENIKTFEIGKYIKNNTHKNTLDFDEKLNKVLNM